MIHAFLAAIMVATADATPVPSPSPIASTSPTPAKHTLTLAIPSGWRRTESGTYNEWRSPDGMANFRIAILSATPEFHGPNAGDAVRAFFEKTLAQFSKIRGRTATNTQVTVKPVQTCNGTQQAYRVDDPLGMGSAGFMEIVPGTDSSGLINYEVMRGGKQAPAILAAIDKICWP